MTNTKITATAIEVGMDNLSILKLSSLNPKRYSNISLNKAIADYAYYVKCFTAWKVTKDQGIELSKVQPKTFEEWRKTEI